MGDFLEIPLDPSSAALAVFRENYGFVPRLFRAQGSLPRLVEAEAALANSILYHDTAFSRIEKESRVLAEAAACGNAYCAALQWQTLLLLGVPPEQLTRLTNGDPPSTSAPLVDESNASAWANATRPLATELHVAKALLNTPLRADKQSSTVN